MLRSIFVTVVLLVFAPLAVACSCGSGGDCQCGGVCSCGGGGDEASAGEGMTVPLASVFADDAAGATTVHVDVEDFDFSANAVIHVGDTVQWDWISGAHTVTSVSGSAEEFESGFKFNGSFSHVFTQAGTFWYYCQLHGSDNFDGTAGGMAAFVTVLPVHNAGDTNSDGVVDLADLNNVLNNFGSAGTLGDDNGSGTVELGDLNNVLNNFGTHYDAEAALDAVPEPAGLSLLGLGALAVLARRRRA